MNLWFGVVLILFGPSLGYADWEWSGDFRLRTQFERSSETDSRWSEKLRLRFGLKATLDETLKAEIRLATAKSSRSTNITLGDNKEPGARRRYIGLDLAYAQWAPIAFATLYAGRLPQLHFRPGGSQVLLDEDLALEGAGINVTYALSGGYSLSANGGSVFIRENYDFYYSDNLTDSMVNWAQIFGQWRAGNWKATLGGGFFNFVGVQDKNFANLVSGGTAGGNAESSPGVVANPYLPRQYFFEGKWRQGDGEWGLFVERVVNNEVARQNSAWWTGVNYQRGSWDAQLTYGEVQADAVLSAFTNSDFGGGETDCHGLQLVAGWKFAKNMSLRWTQFDNHVDATGLNQHYWRTHLDLAAKF